MVELVKLMKWITWHFVSATVEWTSWLWSSVTVLPSLSLSKTFFHLSRQLKSCMNSSILFVLRQVVEVCGAAHYCGIYCPNLWKHKLAGTARALRGAWSHSHEGIHMSHVLILHGIRSACLYFLCKLFLEGKGRSFVAEDWGYFCSSKCGELRMCLGFFTRHFRCDLGFLAFSVYECFTTSYHFHTILNRSREWGH